MPFSILRKNFRTTAAILPTCLIFQGCAAINTADESFAGHPYSALVTFLIILLLSALSAGLIYAVIRRRKAEIILRQSRENYRALVENTPDLIMRMDSEGRHLYVSPSLFGFFRLTPNQILGKTFSQIDMPEHARKFFREAIEEVFETSQNTESEFTFHSDSGLRVANLRLIPEKDESGEFTTVLAIFRDITEHRKIEKDYKALFNSMLSAFCLMETTKDEAGEPAPCRFVDVNPVFERLFGVDRQEIAGKSVDSVFRQIEKHWIEEFIHVAVTGEPMNFENFSEDGSRFFSGYAYSPAPGRFACIFDDVTRKKLAEEENARLYEQLLQARKMEAVGRLAGGVAHDFNNLLTVILGHMELILEGPENIAYETRESLLQVRLAARRASDLTRQLLAYGRRQTLSIKPLDINPVIRNFSPMLDRLLGESISLEINLDKETAQVRADRGQLEQVLVNLALNAKDAMPRGGRVDIETSNIEADGSDPELPEGSYVMISFADTGVGIDDTALKQIFEPFFTTKEMGKGLGLSSVHGIITQHGGVIKVESLKGEGATFKIFLPQGVNIPATTSPQTQSLPRGSETILLVEDEQSVRAVAKRILMSLGYNIIEAATAAEALLAFNGGGKDITLLLTDIVMPGAGGWELAEKLRDIAPEIRVIFMSGHTDRPELVGGYENFIEKPFSYRDLAEIVRRVLDQPPAPLKPVQLR